MFSMPLYPYLAIDYGKQLTTAIVHTGMKKLHSILIFRNAKNPYPKKGLKNFANKPRKWTS